MNSGYNDGVNRINWSDYPGLGNGTAFMIFLIMLGTMATCGYAEDTRDETKYQTLVLEEINESLRNNDQGPPGIY